MLMSEGIACAIGGNKWRMYGFSMSTPRTILTTETQRHRENQDPYFLHKAQLHTETSQIFLAVNPVSPSIAVLRVSVSLWFGSISPLPPMLAPRERVRPRRRDCGRCRP